MLSTLLPSLATSAVLPNLIFVLQDDMGRYDVAFNGNTNNSMVTHNISSLANDGIVLEHHYVHWHCSPTRRSFLSGRLPIHHHEQLSGVATDDLDLRYSYIAAKLKPVGYATHWYGKGHTGYMSMHHLPTERGFDHFMGFLSGSQSYTSDDRWEDDHPVHNDTEFTNPPPECIAANMARDAAELTRSGDHVNHCKMIETVPDTTFSNCNVLAHAGDVSNLIACQTLCCAEAMNGTCSHLSYTAAPTVEGAACTLYAGSCTRVAKPGTTAQVHFHINPPSPSPPAPSGKSCAASYSTTLYGKLAVNAVNTHDTSKGPLFLYLPFQAVHSPNNPVPHNPAKTTYQGMLWDADVYIGALANALKAKEDVLATAAAASAGGEGSLRMLLNGRGGRGGSTSMWDNTLLVYSSDNGGTDNGGINFPLRGAKHTNWEGGMRVAAFASGGLIPPELRGSSNTINFHIVDWYATFSALAGVSPTDDPPVPPLPIDRMNRAKNIYSDGGHKSFPSVDGVNVWDMLMHPTKYTRASAHANLVLSKEVIIRGNMKLIVAQNNGWPAASEWGWKNTAGEWTTSVPMGGCTAIDVKGGLNGSAPGIPGAAPCLFDLDADNREQVNLATKNPAMVAELWAFLNDTMLTTFCKNVPSKPSTAPGTGCLSTPKALLGPCNATCANAYWARKSGKGSTGPICGVPGCV